MLKRLSLEKIAEGIRSTVIRFPLVVLSSVVVTILGIILIDQKNPEPLLVKTLFTFLISFPIFISATLFAETHQARKSKIGIFGGAIALVIIYFFIFSHNFIDLESSHYAVQYGIWCIGFILLISFIPFIRKSTVSLLGNFWHYNQKVVFNFLLTTLYSAILYIGLVIALLSVNFLFDLKIDEIRYFQLWILIVGIFSPLFFLSRFPHPELPLESTEYPKELRIFTFYILVPLVTLYFLILYSYTAKILFTWEWPKGIISTMVLGFSIVGLFTYVALYPLITRGTKLFKFSQVFFIVLIPQIIVLFFAVWLRISAYGVTEQRYLLVIGGVWLLCVSLYFILSKSKNIYIIPISLVILAFGISWGPWGVFSISEHSQINRLEKILTSNKILVGGKVVANPPTPNTNDAREIRSIVYYLNKNHDFHSIQSWFTTPVSETGYSASQELLEKLGVSRYDDGISPNMGDYVYFNVVNTNAAISVIGYDYYLNSTYQTAYIDGNQYRFEPDTQKMQYKVLKNNTPIAEISYATLYTTLKEASKTRTNSSFTRDEMTVPFENESIRVKMLFNSITGTPGNIYGEARIMFSLKKK